MRVRIFEVTTELLDTKRGQTWDSYNVAAPTADKAVERAKKLFSENLKERLLGVKLLATED